MIAALVATLILVANPQSPVREQQVCHSIQALKVNSARAGLHPIDIDDTGLLTALSAAFKQAMGAGLEIETVLLTAIDVPKNPEKRDEAAKTLLIESDAQGCILPSGSLPTEAWHTILDRASV